MISYKSIGLIVAIVVVLALAVGVSLFGDSLNVEANEEPVLPAVWIETYNGSGLIIGEDENGNKVIKERADRSGQVWEHFHNWRACPISGFKGVNASGQIEVIGGGLPGSEIDTLLNRHLPYKSGYRFNHWFKKKASNSGPFEISDTTLATVEDALHFLQPGDGSAGPSWDRTLALSDLYDRGVRQYSYTGGALGSLVHNGIATFTIRLSKPSEHRVTIHYSNSGSTASAAGGVSSIGQYTMGGAHDYLPISGQAVFQPGETVKRLNVVIINDCVEDAGETVVLRLVNRDVVNIDGSATGTDSLKAALDKVIVDGGEHNKYRTNHYTIMNHDTVVLPAPPHVVENLMLTVKNDTQVKVSWDAPTAGTPPTGYQVRIARSDGQNPFKKDGKKAVRNPGAKKTHIVYKGLYEGDYVVTVRAKNKEGWSSSVSSEVSIRE